MTLLFVSTWWRDNFASEEWKEKLELTRLLPNWHPAWWLCIGFAILLLLVVRESHRLWLAQCKINETLVEAAEIRANEGLPQTAPQVKLTSDRQPEMGSIERLILRNLSNDPIYNLVFQSIRLREGVHVIWKPSDIPVLEGETGYLIAPALIRDIGGNAMEFNLVTSIIQFLRAESNRPTYDIGGVSFSCEDKVQNRYLVRFQAEINFQGNTLTVKDCERVLIGNRPNSYSPSKTAT